MKDVKKDHSIGAGTGAGAGALAGASIGAAVGLVIVLVGVLGAMKKGNKAVEVRIEPVEKRDLMPAMFTEESLPGWKESQESST